MKLKEGIFPTTTRKQNLAAAKACDDHYTACQLFRALQYANDMGTTEADFEELANHFQSVERDAPTYDDAVDSLLQTHGISWLMNQRGGESLPTFLYIMQI